MCVCCGWHLAQPRRAAARGCPGLAPTVPPVSPAQAWLASPCGRGSGQQRCRPMLCTAGTGGCCSSGHYTPCWETCPALTPAQPRPSARAAVLVGARCARSRSPGVPRAARRPCTGAGCVSWAARHRLPKPLPLLLRALQQPLCQRVGPLCSLGHVPASSSQAE